MRSLIITQNITLDGSIEMLGDWFNPETHDDELTAELRRQDETADALLLGRQTFQDFRSYWPHQTDDPTGIADYINGVTKYVVSSTITDPQWSNSVIVSGDAVEQVRTLKAAAGGDIVATGSITLCHTLIAAGLVDEYRLFIYPYIQGGGRRLFPDGTTISGLVPAAAPVTFPGGVTLASWTARTSAARR